MMQLRRRHLLTGLVLGLRARTTPALAASLRAALVLPGKRNDGGFMQAGVEGFELGCKRTGAEGEVVDGVAPRTDALLAALRRLASTGPALVAAHGGQCNDAARTAAAEFPQVQFVVVQGGVEGPNLTSYEVLQEESAFLAGAAAALLTNTGIVAHLSGIRVPPGLKGRAAYAAGVRHARPDVRLLTTFCGEQDDPALARRVTLAQAAAGADIVFTMLNAGRSGAIQACRDARIRQIGNVRDWTQDMPDVFVASALADVGFAMAAAVEDTLQHARSPGRPVRLGLKSGGAVGLALAPGVPDEVRDRVGRIASDIVGDRLAVPTSYEGPEFPA